MKINGSIQITQSYNIDEVLDNGKCLVTFIDLASEVVKETVQPAMEEGGEDIKIVQYIYDAYQVELVNDEDYIKTNYDILFKQAKEYEYNKLAGEVREKRNQLLDETDKECLVDRKPSDEMLEYRQELRDITKQGGFPYDVEFPVKP